MSKLKKIKDKIWSTKVADKKFSEWIRSRDGKCINCGKTTYLTCSHFWNREASSTRYDPLNCDTLCWMPCHIKWEKRKHDEYRTLKLKQLGEEGYAALEKKAKTIMQRSTAIIECMKLLK